MSIDRILMMFAASVILGSSILPQLHHVYWLFLTGFVGVNLLQASLTGFCPLASILTSHWVSNRARPFPRPVYSGTKP